MKAKIAFLYGPKDLRVEEVDLPPLKPNQVLIKTKACGICGSDVECFEGKSDEGRYDIAPYTPGHEWSGQIVEVGSTVKEFEPGMKVTGDCVMACGKCANCKNGLMPSACLDMRELGFRPDSPGAMGEYLILEEEYTHRIPDDWSDTMGAWVETFSVGYWGVWGNGGYVDASDDVVIIGAGPIGLSASMTAKASSAKVIVVEPLKSRRDTILNYGADVVVDPTSCNVEEAIQELTEGRGASVVIECSGNDKGIASVFDIAGHSCRVGLVGHSIGRKVSAELGKVIWKNLRIVGSGGTKTFLPRTIRFLSRIKDQYDFEALNTHYFKFENIHQAFDVACHDKVNARKVMLTF
ncbi:MAG: zinc-binding dehydrogenase [Clostridia bacterium]|nr:zinc-binding dehydrogenase [Clostridia bacterium]